MKLLVHNLGRIEQAEQDIRPLTVPADAWTAGVPDVSLSQQLSPSAPADALRERAGKTSPVRVRSIFPQDDAKGLIDWDTFSRASHYVSELYDRLSAWRSQGLPCTPLELPYRAELVGRVAPLPGG